MYTVGACGRVVDTTYQIIRLLPSSCLRSITGVIVKIIDPSPPQSVRFARGSSLSTKFLLCIFFNFIFSFPRRRRRRWVTAFASIKSISSWGVAVLHFSECERFWRESRGVLWRAVAKESRPCVAPPQCTHPRSCLLRPTCAACTARTHMHTKRGARARYFLHVNACGRLLEGEGVVCRHYSYFTPVLQRVCPKTSGHWTAH